jgi:pimeloyl-ACP methyl ester carboxylesterase
VRRVVAGLVVLALVLVGVGALGFYLASNGDTAGDYHPVPPTAAADTARADSPPDPALASFYSQQLDWSDCGDGDECATLTVPLDYDDPSGETIGIHVLRRPADDQDDKVGSLLVNPGGPGVPGSTEAANASAYFRDPLMRYFDIVGFDPRGTGQSSPVDCLSDAELDAYLAEDPEPDTAQEEREYVRTARDLGRGCERLSGDLASHISTVEAARDMDVLRAALGEEVMTYLGSSYGTQLGATYAELFPDRVGRFVLDGAVDPTLGNRDEALTQAGGFETALRSYVQNCVDTSDSCYLGGSVDEGMQRIRDFLDQVAAQPLATDGDRQLTQGLAVYGIVTPLYDRSLWIVLSQALRAAFDGDGSVLLRLADLYASRSPDGTYADNSMEAFPAISCLDDPTGVRPARVQAELPEFEKVSPTFGEIFAWGLIGCRDWPPAADASPGEALVIDAAGAAPIVVIGTTRDPATPMAWAEALAHELDSGVLVRRDGDGHTGYNSGNSCVDGAVESYLIEGDVPADGLSC